MGKGEERVYESQVGFSIGLDKFSRGFTPGSGYWAGEANLMQRNPWHDGR